MNLILIAVIETIVSTNHTNHTYSDLNSFVTMKLIILDDYSKVSEWSAKYIRKAINNFKPGADRYFTLGLPTGSTPLGTYKKLIEYYK